ncbi:MAG: 4-hydroxy-3-methylbut-2-enyl diphosphate reductase, partial [Bacillota bacterium]|nr:4-hydroxy-3-methylbut-2-enyl diphosphate reductase [Bacillota bacterium]
MAQITVAKNAGFCFGVTRAVETAYKELEIAKAKGEKLYCLGHLIHNKEVTSELMKKGLVTINNIMEVPENSKVLIRAHGEPDSTFDQAQKRGITIIDATCPFVEKIHKIAREAEETLVIGDPNHPEVIGILGSAKKALGATTNPGEVRAKIGPNTTIVAQTTITLETFEKCTKNADCRALNTICNATSARQEAAQELSKKSDLMIVIGDKDSSNSKKLFDICQQNCKKAIFVEKSSDLPLIDYVKYNTIGVAASASAPERTIKEVVARMSGKIKNQNPNSEMAAFMEEIEKSLKLPGRNEIVDGTVVQVTEDYVVVNMGCKKDGILPKTEVALEEGQKLSDVFKAGDEIQAKVFKTDDGDGNILLSKKKLQSGENWDEINAAFESKELIDVTIAREVKGGVIANYKEVSGF